MTARIITLPLRADDPPLFREQTAKNKARGKVVLGVLDQLTKAERHAIHTLAARAVDRGWSA